MIDELEDKAEITWELCKLMRKTRYGRHISMMEYSKDDYGEYVTVTYDNGSIKKVDVTADSGSALIMDVLSHI